MRLQALKDQGASLSNLYVLRATDPISPRVLRDGIEEPSIGEQFIVGRLQRLVLELHEQGRPPVVAVMFDTVRASLSGSEDDSENVAAYLRVTRRVLRVVPNAAAFLVHHAGWQDGEQRKKRERGSSAFRGNADATLYLEVVEDDPENHRAFLELRTLKLRDGERPAPLRLVRERVDVVGFDGHGNALSSCVIVADTRSKADREAEVVAAGEAADRDVDVKVLRAMRDYPAATGQRKLRTYVGLRLDVVTDAVGRVLRAGWALEGKRGQPYQVTPEGLEILASTEQP